MFIENDVLNLLYQINGIRSFLIWHTVVRHGDLAGQIGLIGYESSVGAECLYKTLYTYRSDGAEEMGLQDEVL